MKKNSLIRKDVIHAYRIDSRSPREIVAAGGFHPSPTSALGLASGMLNGKAFCAGECLNESLRTGKKMILPKQAGAALRSVVSAPGVLHIYYLNLLDVQVMRYVDNVGIYKESPRGHRSTVVGGALRIFRSETNMNPGHSDSDITNDKHLGVNYDYPLRAKSSAEIGELFVLQNIPVFRILYGGEVRNPQSRWTPL
ncbi:hypothetical protein [Enterobacter mori]|uniref:hypothetical protein n=1 Tax=Enterobacter mori TaxID=539813 RepID=UPI003B843C4E